MNKILNDETSLNSIGSQWSLVLHDNELQLFKNLRFIMNKLMVSRDYCPSFFAGVFHDKDLNDDGTIETPHYQCYVVFNDSYAKKTLLKIICDCFHCNVNQVGLQKVIDEARMCRYLLHRGFPLKHQYDYSELVTSDRDYYDNFFNMVDIKNQIDCISVVEHFHYDLREIILHVSNYKDYRSLIKDLIQDNRFRGRL